MERAQAGRRSLDIGTARALRDIVRGDGPQPGTRFNPGESQRAAYAGLAKQGFIEADAGSYRLTEDVAYSLGLE